MNLSEAWNDPHTGIWLLLSVRDDQLYTARIWLEHREVRHVEGPSQIFAAPPGEYLSFIPTGGLRRDIEGENFLEFESDAEAQEICSQLLTEQCAEGWTIVEYESTGRGSICHIDNAFIGADLSTGSPEILYKVLHAWAERDESQHLAELRVRMLEATKRGRLDEMRDLLEQGARVDDSNQDGTLLCAAAAAGQAGAVEVLLDAGASIDADRGRGRSPLMIAAAVGSLEIVELLLQRGAQADLKISGKTALIHAARAGEQEIFDVLAPFESPGKRKYAAGLLADGLRNRDRRGDLHPRAGQMMWACFQGRLDEVRRLLDLGVGADFRVPGGRGPLHEAARGGAAELVGLLSAEGAAVDDPDDAGYTPLMRAVEGRRKEAASALLRAGADPERAVGAAEDEEMLQLLIEFRRVE